MPHFAKDKFQLPMVRLDLATLFLEAALAAGNDVRNVLAPFGLTPAQFRDHNQFVTAPTMYDVVEGLAELTDDPHCGVHLGEALDPLSWSPLAEATRMAHSVGDLLLRFSIGAHKDASSVEFRLETRGSRTTFAEHRLTDGGRLPRHNDGFGAAYLIGILRAALGRNWVGNQVIAGVCDPAVFPPDYHGIKLAQTDTRGFSVSFPSAWLLLEPQLYQPAGKSAPALPHSQAPEDTLLALHYILEAHLHEPRLDTARVAQLAGVSKRTLVRRLSELDTSFKSELDQLRLIRAKTMLREGAQSITQVAANLGYTDASVFTRAFKRWTGQTPRAFQGDFNRDEI
ncbi:AraC family transcriptional regulator [Pseudohalioglobus sediminis]|uniref:AraC family transcriptional regulator n=1 Tax=Pseudohalioglobus sediminis TaxID=2606449 RepID=A0A5B0WYB3_9GAMM|nr:AraC family transcriptional regulator [Pseudohalioglobus sediminis]KAA1191976.1 AraC family transcriptional regulator [Pseudohalioglobus sediminis]